MNKYKNIYIQNVNPYIVCHVYDLSRYIFKNWRIRQNKTKCQFTFLLEKGEKGIKIYKPILFTTFKLK